MANSAIQHGPSAYITNVGRIERWTSIIGGIGLASLAASLIGRGATRYCPVKARVREGTRLRSGVAEQWRRATAAFHNKAAEIEDMDSMYLSEIQELYDSGCQLTELLPRLEGVSANPELARLIDDYRSRVDEQLQYIAGVVEAHHARPDEHRDQAMKAMFDEAVKMTDVHGNLALRDAGLIASLQRIIHYRIATLGTVATYAKILGRGEEAGSFATFADEEKHMDRELTDLAKSAINLEARSA